MSRIIRLVTCGSVDDGKSTLIGRLLYETQSIPLDTLEMARTTRRAGSLIPVGEVDFSLLTDGLEAEREQGITIDVAYRSMDLANGDRLLIADSPGHEQYTRNMAVATSSADIAIVLVDASRQITSQTKRHLSICSLLHVEHVLVAINKMDATGFSQSKYEEFKAGITDIAQQFEIKNIDFIPVSALTGDNVAVNSSNMPWFTGSNLLDRIQSFQFKPSIAQTSRMQVQNIIRDSDFRGIAGRVQGSSFKVGEVVQLLPSKKRAKVARILIGSHELNKAEVGKSVTLLLEPDVDANRGDLVVKLSDEISEAVRKIRANLIWMDDRELVLNRSYLLAVGSLQIPMMVSKVESNLNIETLQNTEQTTVRVNDICTVEIVIDHGINIDIFDSSKDFGSFILIDRGNSNTAAAGMVLEKLGSASDLVNFDFEITSQQRAEIKNQVAKVIWLTGLSGSGKSTIANACEKALFALNKHCYVLDGDKLRHGLSKDLGFSSKDRAENVRRVSEVAKILHDSGLIVLVALVSPFEVDRQSAKELFTDSDFNLVWVNTPEEVCISRDTKGLYKKAAAGQIENMTGIGQSYEEPTRADLVISGADDLETNVAKILRLIGIQL